MHGAPPRRNGRPPCLHPCAALCPCCRAPLQSPDPICLSYTHDPDYGEYRPYPEGKQAKPEARRMHLARFSTQEASLKAEDLKARGTTDYGQQSWGAGSPTLTCPTACPTACPTPVPRLPLARP